MVRELIEIPSSAFAEKVLQGFSLFSNIDRVQLIGESYWYVWAEETTKHVYNQLIDLGWCLEKRDGCEFVWVCNV
jgi:hypothetical protein